MSSSAMRSAAMSMRRSSPPCRIAPRFDAALDVSCKLREPRFLAFAAIEAIEPPVQVDCDLTHRLPPRHAALDSSSSAVLEDVMKRVYDPINAVDRFRSALFQAPNALVGFRKLCFQAFTITLQRLDALPCRRPIESRSRRPPCRRALALPLTRSAIYCPPARAKALGAPRLRCLNLGVCARGRQQTSRQRPQPNRILKSCLLNDERRCREPCRIDRQRPPVQLMAPQFCSLHLRAHV